jgi:hypothetical protein
MNPTSTGRSARRRSAASSTTCPEPGGRCPITGSSTTRTGGSRISPLELVKFRTEESLRRAVADLNVRIERAKRGLIEGPSTILPPLDADEVVDAWRRARAQ